VKSIWAAERRRLSVHLLQISSISAKAQWCKLLIWKIKNLSGNAFHALPDSKSDGKAFYALGPATVNDLSVICRRVLGTVKSLWTAERRRLSVHRLQSSSISCWIVCIEYDCKQVANVAAAGEDERGYTVARYTATWQLHLHFISDKYIVFLFSVLVCL